MRKNVRGSQIATVLVTVLLAGFFAALVNSTWKWSLIAILAVVTGITVSRLRQSEGSEGICVAEVPSQRLSQLQEVALERGLRSIDVNPIGQRLDQESNNFAIVRARRRSRRDGSAIVSCIIILFLRDGSVKVGELEMDQNDFDGLTMIADKKEAEQIIKSHANAPVFRG